jgi:hypothetical protein
MWNQFGASVRGSSHKAADLPCQDAFTYAEPCPGVAVLVMADGAGSAALGERGAKVAVGSVIKTLNDQACSILRGETVASDALRYAITVAHEALLTAAESEGRSIRDFATTLQIACLTPEVVAYGRVGDGGCVMASADGTLVALSPRPRNVFVNETTFVTCDDVEPEIIAQAAAVEAVAMFTDGLQPVAMNLAQWHPHERFFTPLFAFARRQTLPQSAAEALLAFLSEDRIEARTDDDRSLILCVRTDAVPAGSN